VPDWLIIEGWHEIIITIEILVQEPSPLLTSPSMVILHMKHFLGDFVPLIH
jgi:hypothetical protein